MKTVCFQPANDHAVYACDAPLAPGESVVLEALRLWCAGLRRNDYGPWADAWSLLAGAFGPAIGRAALSEVEAAAACIRPSVAQPPGCAVLSGFEERFIALMRSSNLRDARAIAETLTDLDHATPLAVAGWAAAGAIARSEFASIRQLH